MKSVMLSIKPKYCELIVLGLKTVELRKTKPKIETPFKCYIYVTKNNLIGDREAYINRLAGKVIGEFMCDKIDRIVHGGTSNENIQLCIFDDERQYIPLSNGYLYYLTQIPFNEVEKYSNGGDLYGWHIKGLVIYDEPKELNEFYIFCPEYEKGKFTAKCRRCKYCFECFNGDGLCLLCDCLGEKPITRPPQSWCYVEGKL